MEKPLTILFLLEDLCHGGTQKQTLELASRLDRKKFRPVFLTLTGPTDMDDQARAADIEVVHMGRGRKAAPLFFLRLYGALKKIRPDMLFLCTALPNIWGRIWGTFLKRPVIGSCRGGGAPKRQHERFLWPLTANIVCNSRPLIKAMVELGVKEDHLTLIANGVDTALFTPGQSLTKPVILCVARLAKDKDHQTLLRAFGIVQAKKPDAVLRLVGGGPEERHLREFARENFSPQAFARVEFAGDSSWPLPFYQQASIFALASVREGTPNVILEAMSCGLPVCATNVGGIPDLVQQGKTGFLSDPGDAEALAANLLTLLESEEIRISLGSAGRKAVEQAFSHEAMVKAHEELFARLWQSRSTRERVPGAQLNSE